MGQDCSHLAGWFSLVFRDMQALGVESPRVIAHRDPAGLRWHRNAEQLPRGPAARAIFCRPVFYRAVRAA